MGDVLGTIPRNEQLSETEKFRFASLYAAHGGGDDLWKAVGRTEFRSKLSSLKRTLALEQLTGAHLPMIKALQSRRGGPEAESTAYLTAVSPKEWRALVAAKGTPDGVSPAVYAERLQSSVERAHPAPALLERLKTSDVQIRNFPTAELKRFLVGHSDFDFGTHAVDAFLDDNGIESDPLRQALKDVKRALPLAGGRIDAAAAIVDAGLKNSHQIAMAGPDKVKALLSGALKEDIVSRIVQTASDNSTQLLALGSVNFGRPFAMGGGQTIGQPSGPAPAAGPTLRSLFGSMDFCECRHCRSVLGPAAYLADLLHFLETLPISNLAGKTALDGLLARRPDLQHLELSCENTSTEIPYIDLVLEVLENAAALPLSVVVLRVVGPGGVGGLIPVGGPPTPPPATVASQLQEGDGLAFDNLPEESASRTAKHGSHDRRHLRRRTNGARYADP